MTVRLSGALIWLMVTALPAIGQLRLEALPEGFRTAGTPIRVLADDFDRDRQSDAFFVDPLLERATIVFADPSSPAGFDWSHSLQVELPVGQPTSARLSGTGVSDVAIPQIGRDVLVGVNSIISFSRAPAVQIDATAVAAGDWNRDGLGDLAVVGGRPQSLTVLINDRGAPPRFHEAAKIGAGPDAIRLLAVDLNGDGREELVVGYERRGDRPGRIRSYEVAEGGGGLRFLAAIEVDADPATLQTADLDGDGFSDLVMLDGADDRCRNGYIVAAYGDGDGSFSDTFREEVPCPFFSGGVRCPLSAFVAGPATREGVAAVVAFLQDPRPTSGGDAAQILLARPQRDGFLSGQVFLTPRGAIGGGAGDFDGDRTVDVVMSFEEGPQLRIFRATTGPGLLPNGVPCQTGSGCLSGICAEGVCCASECADDRSCTIPLREGRCEAFGRPPAVCDTSEECFGFVAEGQPGFCVDSFCCGSICEAGERCDYPGFEGTCFAGTPKGGLCCRDDQCASGFCRDGRCCDSDCAGGYCGENDGECRAKIRNGGGCATDRECASGICDRHDAVCCDTICGRDEVCAAPGREGACRQRDCAGDCDRDQVVTVAELVRGVLMALGSVPTDQCAAFDSDGDGLISVSELMAAVVDALRLCSQPN